MPQPLQGLEVSKNYITNPFLTFKSLLKLLSKMQIY